MAYVFQRLSLWMILGGLDVMCVLMLVLRNWLSDRKIDELWSSDQRGSPLAKPAVNSSKTSNFNINMMKTKNLSLSWRLPSGDISVAGNQRQTTPLTQLIEHIIIVSCHKITAGKIIEVVHSWRNSHTTILSSIV
jgi:hypothetical protein